MGTWGVGVFENDNACDWAYELEESDDLSVIESALDSVLDSGADYLDADVAEEGLAAAEVVACLQGNCSHKNAYTESIQAWIAAHPFQVNAELAQKAAKVVERVVTDPSELKELWGESEEPDEWETVVAGIRERIITA